MSELFPDKHVKKYLMRYEDGDFCAIHIISAPNDRFLCILVDENTSRFRKHIVSHTTRLVANHNLNPQKVTWLQCNPSPIWLPGLPIPKGIEKGEWYQRITFVWNEQEPSSPRWRKLSDEKLQALCDEFGVDKKELSPVGKFSITLKLRL